MICDACGESLDPTRDRTVTLEVIDGWERLSMNERKLDHTFDFHRTCFLASIQPTFDELEAR